MNITDKETKQEMRLTKKEEEYIKKLATTRIAETVEVDDIEQVLNSIECFDDPSVKQTFMSGLIIRLYRLNQGKRRHE